MTKLIPILSGRCIVVELPDGSEFPRIGNGVLKAERTHNDYSVSLVRLPLPPGNWRIVSTLADLTEEWCKGVVDGELNGMRTKMVYKHYKGLPMWFFTALESFHSAIRASGWYLENPHGKSLNQHCVTASEPSDLAELSREWRKAQSRTLPVERTLILEKI